MSPESEIGVTASSHTRLLFLGDAALTDGFQLIGFETWADPSVEALERVLGDLLESRSNAFIIIDNRLAASGSTMLARVRREGGRILISEVPPLNDPEGFHGGIDNQVDSLSASGGLEPTD
ncbi:MAG: ATPase [Chromatiaceae bacterium]|nr:ATPase [Chromatiaceae bacterium]